MNILAHRRASLAQGKCHAFVVTQTGAGFIASGSRIDRLTRAPRAGLGVFQRAANFLKLKAGKAGKLKQGAGCVLYAPSAADAATAESRDPGSIRCWIVGATGFRQSLDRPTGLELLWQKLRSLSAPDVCVLTPQAWDADAEALAEYIARNSVAPSASSGQAGAQVFFYGYSYGVGHFFIRLARALKRLGIPIAMAVSCDGIRRFRAAKPLSLRFFDLFVTIPVPANVAVVYAFRQSEDGLLRGHRLVAEAAAATQIHDCPLGGYDHYDIDESTSFHRVVLTEARDLIHQTNNAL